MTLLLNLLIIAAGLCVALQQVLNANLRQQLGSPWWAGFISYLGGTVVMLLALLATRSPLLTREMIARTSWQSWTGGLLGATFIIVAILMIPRMGAATVLTLLVVGQLLASLLMDHFGLLGLTRHPINPIRLLGAACLLLAAILIRW